MTEKPGQGGKLLPAALSIRAVVHFLLVHGRVQVLAKSIGGIEASVADVAFPVGTVVSTRSDSVLHACLGGTFNHLCWK